MSTTLLECEEELSKQLGDYWASTTDGAGTATTLVDTALKAKANDWITDDTWAFLVEEPASAAAIYDERKVSSLSNSTGTLTTLAFAAAPGTGIDYELHRLFSPSDKRIALISATKSIYPSCFTEVWDESLVSGNWLKDGSFERWATTATLSDWTEDSVVTLLQTTDVLYVKHGANSVQMSVAAGKLTQTISNFSDLKNLAGKTVTFSVQGWCNTASCLRIQIYDGTTTTTSSYHDGDSAWTEHNDPMEIQVQIGDNPTEITFRILHDVAAGTSYVDDARVISDYRGRIYIGNLGLAQNKPHQVFIEPTDYSQEEDWIRVRDYKVDKNGYLYIPTTYSSDYRLRIRGIGYLDFLVSGVSSTLWTATIELEAPQLEILVAQAAIYLCNQMIVPNFTSGTSEKWIQALGYWKTELAERKAKFGMPSPSATVHWGV